MQTVKYYKRILEATNKILRICLYFARTTTSSLLFWFKLQVGIHSHPFVRTLFIGGNPHFHPIAAGFRSGKYKLLSIQACALERHRHKLEFLQQRLIQGKTVLDMHILDNSSIYPLG